jgi:hypothetical protein
MSSFKTEILSFKMCEYYNKQIIKYLLFYILQRSLVAKVQRRQMPDVGMLFLNLTVRRSHIVADSLNEVGNTPVCFFSVFDCPFPGESRSRYACATTKSSRKGGVFDRKLGTRFTHLGHEFRHKMAKMGGFSQK